MSAQYRLRKRWDLLALLLFAVASCSSNAFSSPSLTFSSRQSFGSPQTVIRTGNRKVERCLRDKRNNAVAPGALSGGGQPMSILQKFNRVVQKNLLIVGMIGAVALARLYPALGKNGGIMRPELFIGKFGVTIIFLLSGLSLELSELKQAFSNFKLNACIQCASFIAWPFLFGLPFTQAMNRFLPNYLPKPILDGLLILTCLPTTVNMCVFLTAAAGGNVASALCNAVISNMAGILLTPALLMRFFGAQVQLPFLAMVWKLVNKVVLPVALGQALRLTKAKGFYIKHSKRCKKIQEGILVCIIWNAFCEAFSRGWGLQFSHAIKLMLILPVIHLGSLRFAFKSFEKIGCSRGDVVAAMFCSSHKTLAFGLPLVNTIFEGNPNLACYCAPLMLIHPLQLILGSFLLPRLEKYTLGEG